MLGVKLASKRDEILGKVDLLSDFPDLGSANVPKSIRQEYGNSIRKLVVSPFDIVYAYDQDAPEKLSLGLSHKVRISRIVDIVGPTDFLSFGDNMKTPTSKLSDKDPRKPIRILLKRLVGMADDAPDEDVLPLAAKWSPVNLVTSRSVPTMMAYGQLMPLVKTISGFSSAMPSTSGSIMSNCGSSATPST